MKTRHLSLISVLKPACCLEILLSYIDIRDIKFAQWPSQLGDRILVRPGHWTDLCLSTPPLHGRLSELYGNTYKTPKTKPPGAIILNKQDLSSWGVPRTEGHNLWLVNKLTGAFISHELRPLNQRYHFERRLQQQQQHPISSLILENACYPSPLECGYKPKERGRDAKIQSA